MRQHAAATKIRRCFRPIVTLGALVPVGIALIMAVAVSRPVAAGRNEHTFTSGRDGGRVEGEWSVQAKRGDGRVDVTLKREWRSGSDHSSWRSTFDADRSDLGGITASQWSARDVPVAFKIARDAGTFNAEGRMRKGRGSGRFVFVPDLAFQRELDRLGIDGGSDDALVRLCLHDVPLDWIRGFDSLTLRGLSLDDLIRLKIHGVTPAYVRAMTPTGPSRYTVDDLVRLLVHGVPATTPRELERLGYSPLTTDDLIRLQENGVTPAVIRRALAQHPNLSVEDLIRLKQHGMI